MPNHIPLNLVRQVYNWDYIPSHNRADDRSPFAHPKTTVARREAQRPSSMGAYGSQAGLANPFANRARQADRKASLKDVSQTSWRLPALHRPLIAGDRTRAGDAAGNIAVVT